MTLSSKSILSIFAVDSYYDNLWDKIYDRKANQNEPVKVDIYQGIATKLGEK